MELVQEALRAYERARGVRPGDQDERPPMDAPGTAREERPRNFFRLPRVARDFSIIVEAAEQVSVGSLEVETPAGMVGKTISTFVGVEGEAHLLLCHSATFVVELSEGKGVLFEEAAARLLGGWPPCPNPVAPELLEGILRLVKGMAGLVPSLPKELVKINMSASNARVAVDVIVAMENGLNGDLDWWTPTASAAEANVVVCKLERAVQMAVCMKELECKEAAVAPVSAAAGRASTGGSTSGDGATPLNRFTVEQEAKATALVDSGGRMIAGASAKDALKVVALLAQPASKAAQRWLINFAAEARESGLGQPDVAAMVQFFQFDLATKGSGKSWSGSLLTALSLVAEGGRAEAIALMAQVDVFADVVYNKCGLVCFEQLVGLGGETCAALRLFAAGHGNCSEVVRLYMLRVEAVFAAAHAGVSGKVPLTDEYQREVQAYNMAYGGYAAQLLKRLADEGGEGERGGASARRGLGAGGEWWSGSDGPHSRGAGGGGGAAGSSGGGKGSWGAWGGPQGGSGYGGARWGPPGQYGPGARGGAGGGGWSAGGTTGAPSGAAFGGVAGASGGGWQGGGGKGKGKGGKGGATRQGPCFAFLQHGFCRFAQANGFCDFLHASASGKALCPEQFLGGGCTRDGVCVLAHDVRE